MRVIVTGSRDWPEGSKGVIHQALLGTLHLASAKSEPLTVVHGGAQGADRIADEWTNGQWSRSVEAEPRPADWEQHGRAAGPRRNWEMAKSGADICLAFLYEPEGKESKGTRHMMGAAKMTGIPVFEFHWKPGENL